MSAENVGSPPVKGLASVNTSEFTSVKKRLSSLCQKRFRGRNHPLGHRDFRVEKCHVTSDGGESLSQRSKLVENPGGHTRESIQYAGNVVFFLT